jgi:hypothetical protein
MPRIKRWFPASHDINGDPEVWELTERFGERALRVWLEILSIGDRNEGQVKGQRDFIATCLSSKCRTTKTRVLQILDYAESRLWLVSDPVLRVRNHPKYHRVREPKEVPAGDKLVSPPSEPSEPTRPKEPRKNLAGDSAPAGKVLPRKPDRKVSDPRVRAVIAAWYDGFQAKFGEPPPVNGAKAGAIAKKLLTGRSEEKAVGLVREFLRSPPEFYAERQLYGLEHILAAAPSLLAKRGTRRLEQEARTCKACVAAGERIPAHLWRGSERLEPCPQEAT